MHRTILFLLTGVVLLVAVAGCAAGSGEYVGSQAPAAISGQDVRVEGERAGIMTFPYSSVDELWRALPAAFQTLGIPAGILDGPGRVFGNYRVTETRVDGRPLRELFRCGSGSGLTRTQYRIQFAVTAQALASRDGGSELRLQWSATGRGVSASASGAPVQCVSNGQLDMRFQEVLEEILRSP